MVDKSTINWILQKIHKRKIMVIGDVIADEYITGNTYRLSREAPIPIIRFQSSEIRPGGAGNVAMNIAAMGGEATIAGVIGSDAYGKELKNIFRRNNISTDLLITDDTQTIIKTRVLAGDINTATQQIFRLDRGINSPYSIEVFSALKKIISSNIKRYDAVVLSDYGEGLFTDGFIRWIIKFSNQKKIIADSRFSLRKFKHITALTPNINELSQIYGKYVQGLEELIRALKRLKRLTSVKYILLKRGKDGISIFKDWDRLISFKAFGNTEVADVTGAGDTVLAAFSLAISSDISPKKSAIFANIAGGIKVLKRGTVPVSREDIIRAINGKKI
ncbi:MAG: bifunctional heptose 7-phosphate kinase/heptose 1-phosphate adenyltransferase [Myxococcota bacterium]